MFHVGAKSALLRRLFMPMAKKDVIRPLPCSSFPTAPRCAGLAVGGPPCGRHFSRLRNCIFTGKFDRLCMETPVRQHNHNHRPCRWFAQAPLGPFTSRAYRLTTEFLLHGVPCCYSNSGRVLLYSISNISLLSSPSVFTVSSLRSDIFSGHS